MTSRFWPFTDRTPGEEDIGFWRWPIWLIGLLSSCQSQMSVPIVHNLIYENTKKLNTGLVVRHVSHHKFSNVVDHSPIGRQTERIWLSKIWWCTKDKMVIFQHYWARCGSAYATTSTPLGDLAHVLILVWVGHSATRPTCLIQAWLILVWLA